MSIFIHSILDSVLMCNSLVTTINQNNVEEFYKSIYNKNVSDKLSGLNNYVHYDCFT